MSKRKKKFTLRLTKHYSGRTSDGFWDVIASLEGETSEGAYVLGYALQDMESKTLEYIRKAVAEAAREGG